MTLPGETLATGASPTCDECNVTVEPRVCSSGAGYYVGTYCNCGPYSRESSYYRTEKEAAAALADGSYFRP